MFMVTSTLVLSNDLPVINTASVLTISGVITFLSNPKISDKSNSFVSSLIYRVVIVLPGLSNDSDCLSIWDDDNISTCVNDGGTKSSAIPGVWFILPTPSIFNSPVCALVPAS